MKLVCKCTQACVCILVCSSIGNQIFTIIAKFSLLNAKKCKHKHVYSTCHFRCNFSNIYSNKIKISQLCLWRCCVGILFVVEHRLKCSCLEKPEGPGKELEIPGRDHQEEQLKTKPEQQQVPKDLQMQKMKVHVLLNNYELIFSFLPWKV